MKRLYGIGTGPGDKELLTIKAIKKIQGAGVVFAPNNKGKHGLRYCERVYPR